MRLCSLYSAGTCFGRPCEHTAHGQWQTFDAEDTNVTFSLCLFQSSATDHPLWVLPVSLHYKVARPVRWSPLSPQLYQACCSPHSNQPISKQRLYTVCVLGEGGVRSWALTLIMFVRVKPLWFYHLKYIPISLVILTLSVGFSQLYKVHSNNHSQEHPLMML